MNKVKWICVSLFSLSMTLQPEEFRPGLNIDGEGERRLEKAIAEVRRLLVRESVDYESAAAQLVVARREAEALLAEVEAQRFPFPFEPQLPAATPIVVLESTAPEEVQSIWQQQLDMRLKAVQAVLTDGPESFAHWDQVIGVNWRHRSDLSKRTLPVVEALREAHKDLLLLQRPRRVIRVQRGELLFRDELRRANDRWYMYGPAETTYSSRGMRRRNKSVRHADTMVWTKKEFEGNFLFECTFVPHNEGTAGALFAICGRPVVEGTDLSVSCGETMDVYNYGVHAYHFSVHRSQTDLCNGRKVGSGLKLICSRSPDPAAVTGERHRIAIGKWGNVIFLQVNGHLIHNYYDAGTFGPPLERGSLGIRHWGGLDATYSDVLVHSLVREERE